MKRLSIRPDINTYIKLSILTIIVVVQNEFTLAYSDFLPAQIAPTFFIIKGQQLILLVILVFTSER